MGANTIGAAGVPLPAPASLFPVSVGVVPGVTGTNRVSLPPGGDFVIPAGTFLITPGQYSSVQVLDPVTQAWGPINALPGNTQITVNSDGVNYRILNPLGFPVGAIVTNGGTGFTSVPTVTATPGGSTWQPVIGGTISAIVANTAGSGAGYAVPPVISIAAPPAPGVQATAVCAISGGIITSVTVVNQGAGYTSLPAVVAIPQQSDVNFNPPTGVGTVTTVNASLAAVTSSVGVMTALLLTNEGNNPLTAAPALTFAGGGGSNAAATVVMALTMVNYAVSAVGSGYVAPIEIRTVGGSLLTQSSGISALNNGAVGSGLFIPRAAIALASVGAGSSVVVTLAANSGVIDGGIFQTVPSAYVVGAGLGSGATITPTMGSVPDTVFITPL